MKRNLLGRKEGIREELVDMDMELVDTAAVISSLFNKCRDALDVASVLTTNNGEELVSLLRPRALSILRRYARYPFCVASILLRPGQP